MAFLGPGLYTYARTRRWQWQRHGLLFATNSERTTTTVVAAIAQPGKKLGYLGASGFPLYGRCISTEEPEEVGVRREGSRCRGISTRGGGGPGAALRRSRPCVDTACRRTRSTQTALACTAARLRARWADHPPTTRPPAPARRPIPAHYPPPVRHPHHHHHRETPPSCIRSPSLPFGPLRPSAGSGQRQPPGLQDLGGAAEFETIVLREREGMR